jgi:poly(hydroxyalkanoate) depolymerase family esterase
MRLLTIGLISALASLVALAGSASAAGTIAAADPAAGSIEEVTGFGSNPGNLRMFRYLPTDLPANRPVVVAMHGCTQDATGYGTNTGWVELADKLKFAVVLPEQQSGNNANKCFNWFEQGDITRGQGEAESISQMISRMITDTSANAGRVYVTGLSAGGAMTSVMLATYPDRLAGGSVVAGLPFRCATSLVDGFMCMNPGKNNTPAQWGDLVRGASSHTGPWPTVSVWQGDADYTVAKANLTEIVDQWTNVHGIPETPTSTDTVAGYPHAVYQDGSGRTLVQTFTLTGMGHGQPVDPGTGEGQCGTAAAYILDVNICAAWHMSQEWNLAG